ncbi:hypothetical protein D3C86_1988980 [compost metagenome]
MLIFQLTKALPREYKFTNGEKIKNEALELLMCIYEASKQSNAEKSRSIEIARKHLEMIRVMTRVFKDLNIWGVNSVVQVNLKIESVSKQLSSWAAHVARVQ